MSEVVVGEYVCCVFVFCDIVGVEYVVYYWVEFFVCVDVVCDVGGECEVWFCCVIDVFVVGYGCLYYEV